MLARVLLRLRFCHADSGQHEPPLLISRPPLPSLVTQLNYSCSEICHDMILLNCYERWTAVVRDTEPLLVIRVPHPSQSQDTKKLFVIEHTFIYNNYIFLILSAEYRLPMELHPEGY